MSLAGRPSQRSVEDELVAMSAGDLYYVCRRAAGIARRLPRASILRCSSCKTKVVATPYVLSEKRALAEAHNRKLVVICDDCVPKQVGQNKRTVIALVPNEDEMREAEKFNRG